MAISRKWSHHTQKVLARQFWVLFWHLAKFCKVLEPPVCLIDFRSFISLDPGRFCFCSSWQSCRTRLVLQLCQLHRLLIRHVLGVIHRRSHCVTRASHCLNGRRARRRGRPASAQRRHLAPVRRLWTRSSASDARMTSTATPPSEWARPFSPSHLSRAESSAAAESPSRAHSSELERAPRCIAAHQNSAKAPPWLALQPPPSSSPWNPLPSWELRRIAEHLHRAAMVDGEPLPVAPPWGKEGQPVRKCPRITLVPLVWPETSPSCRNRRWTSPRSRERRTWHVGPGVSGITAPSSLLFKIQISCNLIKIISPVSELHFVLIHEMTSF